MARLNVIGVVVLLAMAVVIHVAVNLVGPWVTAYLLDPNRMPVQDPYFNREYAMPADERERRARRGRDVMLATIFVALVGVVAWAAVTR